MMLKFLMIGLCLLFMSCDPTYPVIISNSTSDTVVIHGEETNNFFIDSSKDSFVEFNEKEKRTSIRLPPKASINCGMAIAELNNDLPFKKIKIYTGKDSLIATSEKEVLHLFEKNVWGNPRKPYIINIK